MAIKIIMNVKIKNLLICLCCMGFIASCGLKGPLYQTPEKSNEQQQTAKTAQLSKKGLD